MIDAIIMTAALALPNTDTHEPRWMQPSRSAPSADVSFLRCVIRHESAHSGGPTAHNPRSSAAGLFQFLGSTWRGIAKWVPSAHGYSSASQAPASVQWEVALHAVKNGGHSMWRGTHCGHGT